VLDRKDEFHPYILSVFERLVRVPCSRDSVEAELAKEGKKNVFSEFVFRSSVKICSKLMT
jgi:hypothetical protein